MFKPIMPQLPQINSGAMPLEKQRQSEIAATRISLFIVSVVHVTTRREGYLLSHQLTAGHNVVVTLAQDWELDLSFISFLCDFGQVS